MRFSLLNLPSVCVFLSTINATPTWPQSTDELEDIVYVADGFNSRSFSGAVTPCDESTTGAGRITAAEWIRTAYHDMATADVATGVGGLDASIGFETDRGENIGVAFNATLRFFNGFYTPRTSMADLIAFGLHAVLTTCGGPTLTFRSGRTDAQSAGPFGVPQPNETISTLQSRFAKAGFNTQDMIEMVACGHTFGGVHGEDFPETVPHGSAPADFAHFDTTFDHFDNNVVTEYLDGTTTNPLVVGPAGTASDLAVFTADGNVTMKSLANPTTYATRCKSILERMIDTVPKDVTLTSLTPYAVKPDFNLVVSGDRKLVFSGQIRVHLLNRPVQLIRKVQLLYKDRKRGKSCGKCVIDASPIDGGVATYFGGSFQFYNFSATLNPKISISSFEVHIILKNGKVETYTNNGNGFPVQDSVLLLPEKSCINVITNGQEPWNLTVSAAIRKDRTMLPVSLDMSVGVERVGNIVDEWKAISTPMKPWGSLSDDYDLFRVSYTEVSPHAAIFGELEYSVGSGEIRDKIRRTSDILSGEPC